MGRIQKECRVTYTTADDMSRFNLVVKNISWMIGGKFVYAVLSLLFLPVVTKHLPPESYGILMLLLAESAIFSVFFSMGLGSFAGRMIYKYERRSLKTCKKYLGVIFFYIFIFTCIFSAVSCYFVRSLHKLFLPQTVLPEGLFIYTPVMYAFFASFFGFAINTLINFQKSDKTVICELIEFLFIYFFQIIGLVFWGFTWVEIFCLQLIAKGITTLLSVFFIRKYLGFSFKRLKILPKALAYSIPQIPLSFSSLIITQIDKVLLCNLQSMASVGIYSIGSKFSMMFSHVSRPIMSSIKPEFSKNLDDRSETVSRDLKDFFELFLQSAFYMVFIVSIFSREIVVIFTEKQYEGAYVVIPFIIFSFLLTELKGIFSLKFIHKNKPWIIPILVFSAAVANTVLNYLMIPKWNYLGASVATFISSLILFFIAYFISQRLSFTDYALLKNLKFMIFPSTVMVLIIIFLRDFNVVNESLKIVVCFVYGYILFRFLKQHNNQFQRVLAIFMAKARDWMFMSMKVFRPEAKVL